MLIQKKLTEHHVDLLKAIEDSIGQPTWNREAFYMATTTSLKPLGWFDGDELVCFCIYDVHDNELHLMNFVVAPDHQRQGYGRMMMNVLNQKAIEQGCNNLALDVRVTNHRAIDLYQRNGFTIIYTREKYYTNKNGGREDGYTMIKNLGG